MAPIVDAPDAIAQASEPYAIPTRFRDVPLALKAIRPRELWRGYSHRVIEVPRCSKRCADAWDHEREQDRYCQTPEHIRWGLAIEARDGEDAMGRGRWVAATALPTGALIDLVTFLRDMDLVTVLRSGATDGAS